MEASCSTFEEIAKRKQASPDGRLWSEKDEWGKQIRPLIIGLGNELLSDDGFGIHVADALVSEANALGVDIVTSCLAGFSLMDLMQGRREVLIIDSGLLVGMNPGELRFYQDTDFAYTVHLYSQHQADLATVLAFGRELGIPLPVKVDLLLCGAADVVTLCEEMTPRVTDAIVPALDMVRQWCMKKNSSTLDLVPTLRVDLVPIP